MYHQPVVLVAAAALVAVFVLCLCRLRPTPTRDSFAPRKGPPLYSPWHPPYFRALTGDNIASRFGAAGEYADTVATGPNGGYVGTNPPVSPAGVFRNAKLTTCVPGACRYGVDDGRPCTVRSRDDLSAPVVPYETECEVAGRCYRGSCCNFDARYILP